jgi:signal transduction histidine kinase
MVRVRSRLIVYLTLDVVLLVFALLNLPTVFHRATVPFDVQTSESQVYVEHIVHPAACPLIREGDKILQWNEIGVKSIDALEFLCDLSAIGDKINFVVARQGIIFTIGIDLVPFYDSPRFISVMIIVGLIIWGLAIVVAWNRLDGPPAYSLHWALIGLAVTLLLTQGRLDKANYLTLLGRAGLYISYLSMAALFFFFSTVYPRNKLGSIQLKVFFVFLPVAVIIGTTVYYFFQAIYFPETSNSFLIAYDVYHAILIFFAIGIIISVLDSYRRAQSAEDRARLQWILWGFIVGQIPFVLLILLPQILFNKDWIPEEYATVFLLAVPFSFAISFIKYHLLDIQLIINRSIVYSVLTLFIGLLYILVIVLGVSIIGGEMVFTETLVILLIVVLIAWFFHPLRLRLQRVVDEIFFPARVNYGRTLMEFNDTLRFIISIDELAQCIVQKSVAVVPVSTFAVYLYENDSLRCRNRYGGLVKDIIEIPSLIVDKLIPGRPIILASSINSQRGSIDDTHQEWLKNIGYDLCIPMLSEAGELQGIITASPKFQDGRFEWDEIGLLLNIAAQSSQVLTRLLLQKKMIIEREERLKMEELNRIKSDFVSGVSHELRTPLTSIRMFAETLKQRTIRNPKKQREYIDIINQESERLSRLVDNVLDFSRVERGVKEYHMVKTDIRQVIRKSVSAMQYQFKKSRVKFRLHLPRNCPQISADADALEEAVINLLSNAVKYSIKKKEVNLTVRCSKSEIRIQVRDRGIGIPQDEYKNLFTPYYRLRTTGHIKGMGLGLSLVKNIINAHQGSIEVNSIPGKGSQFTLRLPVFFRSKRNKE